MNENLEATNSHVSADSANHRFAPPADFAAGAVADSALYTAAEADRLGFWADQARQLHWHKPFDEVLDWSGAPVARWFADGELNVAYNCLDRHVIAGNGDRIALHWEGEPGDSRSLTYRELTAEVMRAANLLTSLGVVQGDRVAIYLPMIPEAVIAMLAVARLGAIHSVVFGGFSAESLRARIDDAGAKLVITADGTWRKGKVSPLKPAVDAALDKGASTVEHLLVVRRAWSDEAVEAPLHYRLVGLEFTGACVWVEGGYASRWVPDSRGVLACSWNIHFEYYS